MSGGISADAVRHEAESHGAPYHFTDDEVMEAIRAEEERWVESRRRIAEALGPSHPRPQHPIPDYWIVEGAALRLWDDLRLPFVFASPRSPSGR